MNDLKKYPKCRAMVKALMANQGYKRTRGTLVNAVTLEHPERITAHVLKDGPFAGVVFASK
jgi:hypothetical protein